MNHAGDPDEHHFLEAANRAMAAGAFDAALANAALTVVRTLRVLEGSEVESSTLADQLKSDAIIDQLEMQGRLSGDLAREFRSLLDNYRRELFGPTEFHDASEAVATAARAAALIGDFSGTDDATGA